MTARGRRPIAFSAARPDHDTEPPFFSAGLQWPDPFSKVYKLAPHNIRVNCVIPGFINTPERFAKWERELAKRKLSPEDAARERSLWSSNQGMRDTRWGTPEEIANLVVFAVSDAASYINGAELVADNAMDKS
jgi:3-oxoacyl-[acyl-carrier protein] reductase